MPKHLISLTETSRDTQAELLELALAMKANPSDWRNALRGRALAMIFEKSSTRTRVSFEIGINQLGGHAVFLSSDDSQIGRGESAADTARVLSRYVDIIMARVNRHETLLELAEHSTIPVINALTDTRHPCQGLADAMTFREVFGGDTKGRKVAWVGDGNNVAASFVLAMAALGLDIAIATPPGYEVDDEVIASAEALGGTLEVSHAPEEAVVGASAVSTDVWISMGQEGEREARQKDFADFTVNDALMARALPEATFMHCLPAHRGEEVSAAVLDGPRSVALDQAENRLHVQKAVMVKLSGDS